MKKRMLCKVLAATATLAMIGTTPVMAGQWMNDEIGWWYHKDDGGYKANEWFYDEDDNQLYYFNNKGYMLHGVKAPDGTYLDAYGEVAVMNTVENSTTITNHPLSDTKLNEASEALSAIGYWFLNGKVDYWYADADAAFKEFLPFYLGVINYPASLQSDLSHMKISLAALNKHLKRTFGDNMVLPTNNQKLNSMSYISGGNYLFMHGDLGEEGLFTIIKDVAYDKNEGYATVRGVLGSRSMVDGSVFTKHNFKATFTYTGTGAFDGYQISAVEIDKSM